MNESNESNGLVDLFSMDMIFLDMLQTNTNNTYTNHIIKLTTAIQQSSWIVVGLIDLFILALATMDKNWSLESFDVTTIIEIMIV